MATMYIERRREKRKLKPDSFYYYLTVQEKTRKKRKYIPLGKVSGLMNMLERNRIKGKKTGRMKKAVDGNEEKGFYPEYLKHLIASAGYSIQGSKIKTCWKRFFTLAAASVRFSMLEPECQDAVKSPENLLRLNREAHSLLKRRNRRGIKTSFQECMGELWPGV
jgi:hypothetical protein